MKEEGGKKREDNVTPGLQGGEGKRRKAYRKFPGVGK